MIYTCNYSKKKSNAWGTDWETQCGHQHHIDAPVEVGFATAPLPNKYGKFCKYCGGQIKIEE